MRSKLLHLRVQAILVDEDDAGDVIDVVVLEPRELTRHQLAQHLDAIDELCTARSAELEAQKPNRAARRSQRRQQR